MRQPNLQDRSTCAGACISCISLRLFRQRLRWTISALISCYLSKPSQNIRDGCIFTFSPRAFHFGEGTTTIILLYCDAYCACSELWAPDVVPDDENMAVILSGSTISVATAISSACISHQRLPIITMSPFRYLRPPKRTTKTMG